MKRVIDRKKAEKIPMSQDDYTELLIHKGLIDPAEYD